VGAGLVVVVAVVVVAAVVQADVQLRTNVSRQTPKRLVTPHAWNERVLHESAEQSALAVVVVAGIGVVGAAVVAAAVVTARQRPKHDVIKVSTQD